MLKSLLDPCSMIRVQTWEGQSVAAATVERALDVASLQESGTIVSGRTDIVAIGPADWLVIATDPDAADLAQRLNAALAGSSCRATNVSQSLARFEIDGPETRELLSKGCSLDLHASRFAPGDSARTRFADMPVILRCVGDSTFECIVTLSFREYLVSWLTDAAVGFS
jgi:sarcosine oxidase subunit gamma